MLAKVSMAKGMVGNDKSPEHFEELFDIYLPGCRRELGKEGFAKLFWRVVDMVARPYVMMCEQEPKIERKIWNFNTTMQHDFNGKRKDSVLGGFSARNASFAR